MKYIILPGAFLIAWLAHAQIPVIDAQNGRLESIRNLDINGTLYNVSFDQSFGSNFFEDNPAGADAATDAVTEYLNTTNFTAVDNGHPSATPFFAVVHDFAAMDGYASCRSGYIPECSNQAWARIDLPLGLNPGPEIYFALSVNLDVNPNDSENKVFPNKGGKLPVAVLSGVAFDATQVDPATVRFGPAAATPANSPAISQVDGQYGADTTLRFWVSDTGIFCNDSEVELSGTTYNGESIAGVGDIDASNCESGGCHPY